MAVELIADWMPLERKLPPELCAEFMWMYREGGIPRVSAADQLGKQVVRASSRMVCCLPTPFNRRTR